jgi:uncharacterized protein (TIGR04255 family)
MSKMQNSPLVEAMFELKWGMDSPSQFRYSSEERDLFPGVFSKAIGDVGFAHSESIVRQPANEKLTLPFEVKHRFRRNPEQWPCYQIGLGIFTVNQIGNVGRPEDQADEYDWDTFKPAIAKGLEVFDSSFKKGLGGLIKPQTMLRYQDAFKLKDTESFETFVQTKLSINIEISESFTSCPSINKAASDASIHLKYETTTPQGAILVSVSNVQISGERGVMIETVVVSDLQSPQSVTSLVDWCEQAHDLQRHAFDTLIRVDAYKV